MPYITVKWNPTTKIFALGKIEESDLAAGIILHGETSDFIGFDENNNMAITPHFKYYLDIEGKELNGILFNTKIAVKSEESNDFFKINSSINRKVILEYASDGAAGTLVLENLGLTANKPLILNSENELTTTDFPNLQIQTDWNQTNTSAIDYIKNKPSGNLIKTIKRVLTRAEILALNTTPITLLPALTGNKVYKIVSITAKKTTTSDAGYNGEIQLGYDTQYGGYAINLDRLTSTTSGVFELNPDDNRFYGITGEIFPNTSLGFNMLNPISEKGTNVNGLEFYIDYYILEL